LIPAFFTHFTLHVITSIQNAINAGLLPKDYYALAEQHAGEFLADVLALHVPSAPQELTQIFPSDVETGGGTALAEAPPKISLHEKIELEITEIQRYVAIRHLSSHRIIALLEIVSPGNKNSEARYETFVHKTVYSIRRNVNVLLIDIHETGRFDHDGINARIRNMLSPQSTPTIDRPRHSTLASYCPDPLRAVDIYLEHVAPDMPLPDMPIFLNPDRYVNVPLEAICLEAWKGIPTFWRNVVLGNPAG
jgi:hypothetical protein